MVTVVKNFSWITPVKLFNNTLDEEFDGVHVKLETDDEYYKNTLTIKNFREAHVGVYSCVWAETLDKTYISNTFKVNLTKVVEVDTIAGQYVKLKCDRSYSYEYEENYWEKDGMILHYGYPFRVLLDYNAIEFDSVEVEDSGIYRCLDIKNKQYYVRSIYRLIVTDVVRVLENDPEIPKKAPKTTSEYIVKVVKEGNFVHIPCGCDDCWPLDHYSWTTPFGSDNMHYHYPNVYLTKSVKSNSFSYSISLRVFEKNNTGLYRCYLENSLGSTVVQTLIQLESNPTKNITITENQNITISCDGEDVVNDVSTNSNYTWTHNSKQIESFASDNLRFLTIQGHFNNAGIYECSYINSEDILTIRKTLVLVDIENIPKLDGIVHPDRAMRTIVNREQNLSRITIHRDFQLCDDTLTIECKCIGSCFPSLKHSWIIPESCSQMHIEEKAVSSKNENVNNSQTYKPTFNIIKECQGSFICRMENSNGISEHYFEVNLAVSDSYDDNEENICCPSIRKN
ncbi:hypothetical protein DMENIID0001_039940 [Sergentomyia squamirostris]